MNTLTIPKPKQSPSKTAAYLMRSAFRTLHKGHKKNGLEVIRKLKNELQKIELEIYEERAIEEFMGKVKTKLLEDHPCWIKNGGMKNV